MIRVTIELVPYGDEALKKKIGSLVLANMGMSNELPLYDYAAVYEDDSTGLHLARAQHVRADGVWELIRKLLTEHEVYSPDAHIFKTLEERL